MIDKFDIQDVVFIAKKAGNVIMDIYNQDFEVDFKTDGSPLTLADKRASGIIEHELSRLPVCLPILSEEGKEVAFEERRLWEYFWLVDPLDGTKEFVSKNGEFTVNIALIHKDVPIFGVVYAPVLDVCYWAAKGKGAFKDGQKLPLKEKDQRKKYKVVSSRSHMSNRTMQFIEQIETHKDKEIVPMGSSLKICLVAEGEADIYPRLGPTMEWDTGAAHAIVNESGVRLQGIVNNVYIEFLYNKESMLNPEFVVS